MGSVIMAEEESSPVAMRWSILVVASGLMCGVYSIYDTPASLSTPLQQHLSLSDKQYGCFISSLYTAYAVPNFVLPCVSGIAVNRYGEKHILMLSLGAAVIGQLIFGAALQARSRSMLVFGRVMIGIGSEVPGVIVSDIVTRWFSKHTLSLALALLLCMSRAGSIANSVIIPRLTEVFGVVTATWISTAVGLMLSSSCATAIIIMDTAVSEKSKLVLNYKDTLRRLPHVFWLLSVICVSTYGCLGPFNNSAQRFLASRYYKGDQSAAGLAVSIPNTLASVLVLPFGLLLELPRLKNYAVSILLSGSLMLLAHLCFLLYINWPVVPLVFLGVGYASFGVAFWPAVAVSVLRIQVPVPVLAVQAQLLESRSSFQSTIVPELEDGSEDNDEDIVDSEFVNEIDIEKNGNLVVIAYGIMTSLLNLSMGIVPIILAVMESLAGYSGLEMVFVALATVSIFASARYVKM